jgi:hypothetical protein
MTSNNHCPFHQYVRAVSSFAGRGVSHQNLPADRRGGWLFAA